MNQEVSTARGRFHVRTDGPADGVPLVLVHGWPQSGHCWTPVLPWLIDRFRVIRPDLRGLGESERTEGVEHYTKQALAEDMLALLDALEIRDFGLAGHDWGGAVAQEMAVAAPGRVQRLAILNIHILGNRAGQDAAHRVHARTLFRAYWYQQFMRTPGLTEALIPGNERAFLSVFLRGKDRDFVFPADALDEYVRCYQQPGTPASGSNYYRAMTLDAPRWKTLEGHVFPMPTALVWGMHDPVVVSAFLTGHEASFEQVEVVEVDASHFLVEEQPQVVGPALARHFAPLAAPPVTA